MSAIECTWCISSSGGASYGAKGLKPPLPDFAQAPPRFLCKVRFSPVTHIIKCHHRRPTFNCEMQKNAFGGRAPLGPAGELTALPHTPQLDLKGPTSKGGEGGERKKRGSEGGKGERRGKRS